MRHQEKSYFARHQTYLIWAFPRQFEFAARTADDVMSGLGASLLLLAPASYKYLHTYRGYDQRADEWCARARLGEQREGEYVQKSRVGEGMSGVDTSHECSDIERKKSPLTSLDSGATRTPHV